MAFEGTGFSGAGMENAMNRDAAANQQQAQADINAAKRRFTAAAEQAAARNHKSGNPINPAAFHRIVDIYNEEFARFVPRVEQAQQNSPDSAGVKSEQKEAFSRMRARIDAVPGGRKAWAAIGQQEDGPGIIETAVKKVYDSDRGGPQWGGIIGAIAGGLLAFNFTSGFGPVINILATAAATALFAFIGDSTFDKPAGPLKLPDFHSGHAKSPHVEVSQHKAKHFDTILAQTAPTTPPPSQTFENGDSLRPSNTPTLPLAVGRNIGV